MNDITKELFLVGDRFFRFKHLPEKTAFLTNALPLFCALVLQRAGEIETLPAYDELLSELVAQMCRLSDPSVTADWVRSVTDCETREGLIVRQVGFEMATDEAITLLSRMSAAIQSGPQA